MTWPLFRAIFDQKMAKFSFFSYYSSTTAPRKMILNIHTHTSPSSNNWSLTKTLKVTGGHCRSTRSITNEAKTKKQMIFKQNLFGNFYSTLNLHFKWYAIYENYSNFIIFHNFYFF